MAVNWSWPKATALSTAQATATSLTALIIGHEFLEIDWVHSLETAALTGFITFLRAVAAYTLPSGKATAIMSATVGAAQDAAASSSPEEPALVYDAGNARGA